MKAYLIKDGVVENSILVDSLDFMPGLVEATEHADIGWIYQDGSFINPNQEKENNIEAQIAESVRQDRDALLLESDWTQGNDAPVNKDDWSVYRQALRDIPSQDGFPREVIWPSKPE